MKTYDLLIRRMAGIDTVDTGTALSQIKADVAEVRAAVEELNSAPPKNDSLMTVTDAASYLNISVRTLETLIADEALVPIRIRARRLFLKEGLDAYIRSLTRQR